MTTMISKITRDSKYGIRKGAQVVYAYFVVSNHAVANRIKMIEKRPEKGKIRLIL